MRRSRQRIPEWRDPQTSGTPGGYGRWLLIVAGLGIFCGCVGKSAQFPLHVWLPDAMEGPTPVSALVHSATMVAAGVYLVGRFYPVFTPEVLLVIAIVGCITLFMAATIAITATDIKRVLAYSTVSQLGYMMLALGVGGWLAGVLHLITHAFFKSLLFLCSRLGDPRRAHQRDAGDGRAAEEDALDGLHHAGRLPGDCRGRCAVRLESGRHSVHLGLSGYYSKDAILEQALSFRNTNPGWGDVFFLAAAGGAAITAFYMFRLWYMTFAGEPRDQHRYEHAHESPPVMYRPLVVLAVLAVGVAWGPVEGILGAWSRPRSSSSCGGAGRRSLDAAMPSAEPAATGAHGATDRRHGRAPALIGLGLSLAVLLIAIAWLPMRHVTLGSLLEQARPAGTLPAQTAACCRWFGPANAIATWLPSGSRPPGSPSARPWPAFCWPPCSTDCGGWMPREARRSLRADLPLPVEQVVVRRAVRPAVRAADARDLGLDRAARPPLDRRADRRAGPLDAQRFAASGTGLPTASSSTAWSTCWPIARTPWDCRLRRAETGKLRQYVMFIAIGTVVVFALVSFWRYAFGH